MADATPSIIWALRPEGSHRYLNQFALDYLGIAREEVAEMNWDAFIHPDDLAPTQKVLSEAMQRRLPYSHEHRLRRHDGEYRWFLSQGAPSYYAGDELYGYVGSGTDIHAWRIAQEILRKNEEMLENLVKERTLELQRSNDDLQQFAHVASHDLKEPIRKIKIFSYKLQDEFGNILDERGTHLLNKIIHSSDRMFAMINGVLNYSAVTATKNDAEHVDINGIINAVRDDLELLITEKNASFYYGELPTVYANADLIHQLFYNLINNALKFAKPGVSSDIRITWSAVTVNRKPYIEIILEDNGIGFEPEFAEQIFGSFIRLHSKDQYEGSGLGLALCKRIVERYGGSITAEGTKGVGATFKFTLPA
jgi:PAS domain S-box-containing protein